MKSKLKRHNLDFTVFLKGILMGVCDLIPGISGGTVAFITGIYERLINSIKNITPKNYLSLIFSKNRKKTFFELDIFFLLTLFSGIFLAIILGSKIISYFLENYYSFVFAFFTGLILSSSLIILKQIEVRNHKNRIFGILGFIVGLILLFLSPKKVLEPSFLYILFGGFMAIFALFLPGISGSFILVILGLYEYIINLVKDLSTKYLKLIPFAIGAILGVFVISRIIHFLFNWNKSKTLYFLLGLVLGTLFIPIKNVYLSLNTFNFFFLGSIFTWFFIGFYIVKFIEE